MTKLKNPWLSVPPEDYEKHMGHPSVNQQEFMSECFQNSIKKNSPESILILGCGTGCGLEHIDNTITKRVTVIDINAEFLEVLNQRHQDTVRGLEIVNGDLHQCSFGNEKYSLVYAGLVFEFVDPGKVLEKISACLQPDGRFEFVLQLPNESLPQVSSTNIESISKLGSFAKLVNIEEFDKKCNVSGMHITESRIETLASGKSFFIGSAKRSSGKERTSIY